MENFFFFAGVYAFFAIVSLHVVVAGKPPFKRWRKIAIVALGPVCWVPLGVALVLDTLVILMTILVPGGVIVPGLFRQIFVAVFGSDV